MLPNQQIKTTAALALAAIAPTAAAARPQLDPGGATQTPSHANPIVRVITPNSGFDWGDAWIGAAAGLALSMLGVGGTLALSQRRPRQAAPTSRPTTTTTQEHTHHVHA
jgi:hypothetical protein